MRVLLFLVMVMVMAMVAAGHVQAQSSSPNFSSPDPQCYVHVRSGYGDLEWTQTLGAYYQLLLVADVLPTSGYVRPALWLDGRLVGHAMEATATTIRVVVYSVPDYGYAGSRTLQVEAWPFGNMLAWSLYGCTYGPPPLTPTPTPYVYPTPIGAGGIGNYCAWVEPPPDIVLIGQARTLTRSVPGYDVYAIGYDTGASYVPARYEVISWQTSAVVTYTTPISLTVGYNERYDIRVINSIGLGTGAVVIRHVDSCTTPMIDADGLFTAVEQQQVSYGINYVSRDCYVLIPAFTVTVPWDQSNQFFTSPGLRLCVNWMQYRLSFPIIVTPIDAVVPALLILGLAFRVYRLVVR